MQIEVLHSAAGDKVKNMDTSTPECRLEVKKFIDKQIKQGTALFLERGKKTYRVTGYDEKKDQLKVRVEKKKLELEHVAADSGKGRTTAVPPRSGG